VTALTDFLANWLYRSQCPPRGREFFIGSALHGLGVGEQWSRK
jgi:hypothetical protein